MVAHRRSYIRGSGKLVVRLLLLSMRRLSIYKAMKYATFRYDTVEVENGFILVFKFWWICRSGDVVDLNKLYLCSECLYLLISSIENKQN